MGVKLRSSQCGLLLLTGLLTAGHGWAKGNTEQLPLLLVGEEQSLTPAIADFYQALSHSLIEDAKWRPVPRQKILHHLGLPLDGLPLISVPAETLATSEVLPAPQRLVDTLALSGALLLNCQSDPNRTRIKTCELGYYDASLAKITARVRKGFKVPVADASLWAPRLLKRLRTGMATHAEQKMQAKLHAALSRASSSAPEYHLLIQSSGFGEQSGSRRSGINSIAGFGLALGIESDYRFAGLLYEFGRASGTTQAGVNKLRRTSYGLIFGVSSPAMTTLLWDLTVIGGYSVRSTTLAGKPQNTQKQPFFGLQPGLFWRIHDQIACGLYLNYRQYVGGSTRRSGQVAALSSHIFGTGLAVRAQL